MLSDEFRSSSERVVRLRELLNDPILAQAIVCLQDEMPDGNVPMHSDAIASVRALSQQIGYKEAINRLLSLAEPLPVQPEEEIPSWGVLKEPVSTK